MLLNGKEVSIIIVLTFLKVLILSPQRSQLLCFFKGMRLLLPTPPSSAVQLKRPHQRAELREAAWGPPSTLSTDCGLDLPSDPVCFLVKEGRPQIRLPGLSLSMEGLGGPGKSSREFWLPLHTSMMTS